MNDGQWLTAKRLRAHGLLFALAIWSVYIWTLATPGLRDRNRNLKGTDFLHFYTLGSLAIDHRGADLYSMNAQAALAAQRVPQAAGILYLPLYPPQVSIFFAPLAHFSYPVALVIWWILCAAIYAGCCFAVWRACPNMKNYGWTVATLGLGFPAFFHLIAWGQTSAIALACFTVIFLLLRRKHDFLAGIALGCLIFKPQLGLAAAVVFLAIGAWKVIVAALLSAAAELFIGVFYYGMEPVREWVRNLSNFGGVLPLLEPKPYQTHCLLTFWSMLVPRLGLASIAYLISAIVVLAATIALWRREVGVALNLRYSALLLATVLVSPHLTVYDLVVLAPAMLLLADWLIGTRHARSRAAGTLLYLVYALPLLGPLARWTHVQLSVIAMSALLYLIWKMAWSGSAKSEALAL
ncbi:MAG: glycosyltransferase family 87 protein [Candidatus Sulfotelmatobacter sp.]